MPVARLLAFASIGLACLAYLLFSVIGAKTFEGQYAVAVQLSATGGLFPGSQVTYRGVPVGTVTSIDIEPSQHGVVAHLEIHDDVKVPSATEAVVADRSPAGEQYLDLRPTGPGPPYLASNATIPQSQTRLPPSLADLLGSVSAFSHSIDTRELRTVFTQLDAALHGTGPALGQTIDNTAEIVSTLRAVEPQTVDLLDNGGKLLRTQAAHGADLHTFAVSLRKLADTLRTDDPRTTNLIGTANATMQQAEPLLRRDAGTISQLLTNLVTTGTIVDDRIPGLKALLVATPRGLGALASTVHGGHVQFKLLTGTGRACPYRTRREMPYVDKRNPPIFNAYCLKRSPTYQQRGAMNAPRPPGDTTAGPPSGSIGRARRGRSVRGTQHARAHSESWMDVFEAGES
jgi:phospholipid/cholesterol/gamma-HCH transport system substrate-binding protein